MVPNAGGQYHTTAQVFVGTPNTLDKDQIAIVTNCEKAAIFQITNNPTGGSPVNVTHAVAGTPGNVCAVWGTGCKDATFREGSQIAVFRDATFFIGKGSNHVPSLRRITFDMGTAADVELVEGIENMQILYGIDNNIENDGDRDGRNAENYVTANNVTDWTRIVSVRIGLLVGTSNVEGKADTTSDTSTYTLAGATLNPFDDNRRRRVFTTVVQPRSR